MFSKFTSSREAEAKLAALDRSQAVIEFEPDGTILTANNNFLTVMGYSLDEIAGRHHSLFVEASERESRAYAEFWAGLRRGEFQVAEFKRIAKGGGVVWIQASYNPIVDKSGTVTKVVKFATNITQDKLDRANFEGQIAAINRVQAVI